MPDLHEMSMYLFTLRKNRLCGDEDPAADEVGRDQSFLIVVSGVLKPNLKTTFSLFTGLELGGKLKLKGALGELIDESEYDPAPIIGVTFAVRF